MGWLSLETLSLEASEIFEAMDEVVVLLVAIFSIIIGTLFMVFLFVVGIYVYGSFAYMAIGKKAKDKKAWLAWIPIVGKPLLVSRIAKMPWWPVLFLLGGIFIFVPVFGIVVCWMSSITFAVFFLIWRWKTYEKIGHPGWFSLLFLIPILGYVFLGIVAWNKENTIEPVKKRK